jgi:hypothetical protein
MSKPTDVRSILPTPRPWLYAGVTLLASLVLVASSGPRLWAAPAAQQQGEATLYLPMTLRNADGSQTYKPPAKSPTPAPTATPTREASPTVMPTFTPEPTPTPTQLAETGTIHGRYVVEDEPLLPGFGAPGFPQIELRLLEGTELEGIKVANAIVGEDGRFEFVNPPALGGNQSYQVWWLNDSLLGVETWVARWFSRKIIDFGDGEDVDLGTMEIGDVRLGPSPGNDIHYSLPTTYEWHPRDSRPDEIYKWALYESCLEDDRRTGAYFTPSLGHVDTYILGGPPRGFRINEKYCWYVWIDDAEFGTGWSFYRWKTLWLP